MSTREPSFAERARQHWGKGVGETLMTGIDSKIGWEGEILSVQPRIRLTRSFDERSHSYLGYVLRVRGTLAGEAIEFVVALGKGAHEKHQFRVGDRISGAGERVRSGPRQAIGPSTPSSPFTWACLDDIRCQSIARGTHPTLCYI